MPGQRTPQPGGGLRRGCERTRGRRGRGWGRGGRGGRTRGHARRAPAGIRDRLQTARPAGRRRQAGSHPSNARHICPGRAELGRPAPVARRKPLRGRPPGSSCCSFHFRHMCADRRRCRPAGNNDRLVNSLIGGGLLTAGGEQSSPDHDGHCPGHDRPARVVLAVHKMLRATPHRGLPRALRTAPRSAGRRAGRRKITCANGRAGGAGPPAGRDFGGPIRNLWYLLG
jgi:hypothetical protein